LNTRIQVLQESLQKLLRRNANQHVARLLKKARPVDVAVIFRVLDDRQRSRTFELLPDVENKAEMLSELDGHLIPQVVSDISEPELVAILLEMSDDDQADFLAVLSEDMRIRLMEALRPADAEGVEELLHFDPETAGGIMSTEYFSLSCDMTAKEAINALQNTEDVEMAFYIYTVNEHGHLVGVVSLRALVVHPAATPLSDLMETDVISATVNTDQEEVARLAARYNFLAIPVVDDGNHLVGIVTIDDVVDVIREEATEDILKMAGADETAYESPSVLRNVRMRAPWLFATWLAGLAASMLIGVFEDQLTKTVALAAFIPVVLGMGGNVGSQTATIIVRGLATGRVSSQLGVTYLLRETGIGLLLGLLYGVLLAVYAAIVHGDGSAVGLPLTVGLSIFLSMAISACVGATTPLIFNRLNIDPAVATGPIVTTTVDVLGTLTYFLSAALIMGD
jgi:magnesium transporter